MPCVAHLPLHHSGRWLLPATKFAQCSAALRRCTWLHARADGPDDRAVVIVQVAGEELLVQLMSAPIGQCRPLASAGSALRLIPRHAPNLAQVSLRMLQAEDGALPK